MSTAANLGRHQPGTYAGQGVAGGKELRRLQIQDRLVTTGMGGVLPEQSDSTRFERVLDIGCGPGGWLLDVARTFPSITWLIGVDINPKMLDSACAQAKEEHLDDRVEFHQMDALLRLDFPDQFFDLVNERFGVSWLRTWDWPKFLQECQRVVKPGGVIRVTEFDIIEESASPALNQLGAFMIAAFARAGHFFTPERNGVSTQLARLLRQHGLQDVQTCEHVLECRVGTTLGQLFAQDWRQLYRIVAPFLRKWTKVPDDYEEIYQRMLSEIKQPSFVATINLLTAWGTRSDAFSLPVEGRV